jgi:23S rRNA pseudouridine1911/1915/1917 synthase
VEENEVQDLIVNHTVVADVGQSLIRIDKFLNDRLPNASRNKIQEALKSGNIKVNDEVVKPNYKIRPRDVVTVIIPADKEPMKAEPEDIPLDVLFEDDELMVINKPAGLVVHPGVGNRSGTLVNGLLHHIKNLPEKNGSDRPGIVHRLDKLTSGLMVIGKTEQALNKLAAQFFHRTTDRQYIALVWGDLEEDEGTIEGNIGRSLKNRKLMSVFPEGDFGKPAITHYKVLERFGYVSVVSCKLETGRTHQIRVHFKHIGHPLFADPDYGGDKVLKGTVFKKYKQFVMNCFDMLNRQALHAKTLAFDHPNTGKRMSFDSELPEDLQSVIDKWRSYIANRNPNEA